MTPVYHYDLEQRSDEWRLIRRGRFTGTDAGLLLTEGTKRDLIEASKRDSEGELTADHFNYSGGNAECVMEFVDELPSLKGAKS